MSIFSKLTGRFTKKDVIQLPKYKESKLLPIYSQISEKILDMLYFTNGKYKNISANENEPSAIDVELLVSKGEVEPLGYYPSYSEMSPQQRLHFLEWLASDLKQPIEVGYLFILLYCMERHICENDKVDEAVAIIKELRKLTDNRSFKHYSATAIIWAAHNYYRKDYLEGLNIDKLDDTNLVLFFKLSLDGKILPYEMINRSSDLGWKNKRYIKNYPEKFEKALVHELKKEFNTDYFPAPQEEVRLGTRYLLLSNYSLPENKRQITYPEIIYSKQVGLKMQALLELAHEDVKVELRKQRKKKS